MLLKKGYLEVIIKPTIDNGKIFVQGHHSMRNEAFDIIKDSVFCIFYYYRKHRRLYVMQNSTQENAFKLPEMSNTGSLLYRLKSRKLDHMKNALHLLEKEHRLFIYQGENKPFFNALVNLIYSNRNTTSNILMLYEIYQKKERICLKK